MCHDGDTWEPCIKIYLSVTTNGMQSPHCSSCNLTMLSLFTCSSSLDLPQGNFSHIVGMNCGCPILGVQYGHPRPTCLYVYIPHSSSVYLYYPVKKIICDFLYVSTYWMVSVTYLAKLVTCHRCVSKHPLYGHMAYVWQAWPRYVSKYPWYGHMA